MLDSFVRTGLRLGWDGANTDSFQDVGLEELMDQGSTAIAVLGTVVRTVPVVPGTVVRSTVPDFVPGTVVHGTVPDFVVQPCHPSCSNQSVALLSACLTVSWGFGETGHVSVSLPGIGSVYST